MAGLLNTVKTGPFNYLSSLCQWRFLLLFSCCFLVVLIARRTSPQPQFNNAHLKADLDPFEYLRLKLRAAYSWEGDANFTQAPPIAIVDPADVLSPSRSSVASAEEWNGEDNSAPILTAPPSLNFTFTIYNTTFCEDPLKVDFLLVLVHSAPVHFHNRQVIRQTWASKAWRERQEFAVLFLLGAGVSDAVQAKVSQEGAQFGDIVQHSYLDSYRNLTYKNLAGLQYLALHCPRGSYQYVLKTDDDMFLYPRAIVAFLRHERFCQRSIKRTILCAEFQRKEVVQRSKSSKWFVPWDVYGEKQYPGYCYGGGYILTADLVPLLLEAAQGVTYYWIDDVYVTGFVARRVPGIRHVQMPRQNPILGYKCTPDCRAKKGRWFVHTLQRVDLLDTYYRPLKSDGLQGDRMSTSCTATNAPATPSKVKPKSITGR